MPYGSNLTKPCSRCRIPQIYCECGVHGKPGWPGNTRVIPPEELAKKAAEKEAEINRKSDQFDFDGFDD